VERLNTGRRVDPLAVAAAFPDRWMGFLRANFTGPVHVAHTFGVTEKAAQKWWTGIGAPHGSKVAVAAQLLPEAVIVHLFGGVR
jgi:hypothetical protein